MEEYMLPCVNKSFFGIACPGCGTQRALVFLLQGEFSAAFQMFPAIYTTLALFGAIGLHFIDRRRSYHKSIVILAIVNAVITICAYFYKISPTL